MSVKQLSRNKEIRDLIRIARSQGWWIKKLKNSHLRWIPPKGPFVHSSGNINHQGALAKIRHDLEQAGLVLRPIQMEKPKPLEIEVVPEAQLEMTLPPVPEPEPEVVVEPPPVEGPQIPPGPILTTPERVNPMPSKKPAKSGVVMAVLAAYLRKRSPTNLTVGDVYEGVRSDPSIRDKNNVNVGLARLVKLGMAVRVRQGLYKWNMDYVERPVVKKGRKGPTPAEPPKGWGGPKSKEKDALAMAGGELAELRQALDALVDSVSTIESVAQRIAKKLEKLEALKELFSD